MMNSKNIVCFTGPPGVGKGTFTMKFFKLYQKKLDLHRFSVGDELRSANQNVSTGELSSIMTIKSILDRNLELNKSNILIDGFPRNLQQMNLLLQSKANKIIRNFCIVNLFVQDTNILLSRLVNRNNCNSCGYIGNDLSITHCPDCNTVLVVRDDDSNQSAIQKRMQIYYETFNNIKCLANSHEVQVYEFDTSTNTQSAFKEVQKVLLNFILQ